MQESAKRSGKKAATAHPVAGTSGPGEPRETAPVRRELLATEVLDKAAGLFATKGFAATSLKDVAEAVGLGRSSIYYYFPNKDALLAELIQGVTAPVAKIFQEVDQQELDPRPRLHEVVRRLVLWVADPRTHFRLLDKSEAELPPAIGRVHAEAKRRILSEMMKLIDAAVIAGEARPVDTRVAALSIIGMAMWTAWWFQPRQQQSLELVADMIAENALAILQRNVPAPSKATISEVAQDIREQLLLIEKMAVAPLSD